jgi:cation diffusion facilitator family transporter
VRKTVTTKRVLFTSFFVDALDTLINVTIAVFTGSAVMLAESLQGFADLTSVTMLLIGFERSKKRSNKQHPFGYGKELYFWAILSVFLIIGLTATLSFFSGLQRWREPTDIDHILIAYIALGVAVITNSYAFWLSLRKLLGDNPLKKIIKVFLETSDVAPRTTLVLDLMGALSASFGLVSLIAYGVTGDGRYDGLGAMIIGILLAILALTLLFTTKSLVTGRSAPREVEKEIKNAAQRVPQVREVLELKTMMMGTNNLLINIEVHLKDGLSTDEVEKAIDKIRENIQKKVPGRTHISVEPETPSDDPITDLR